jgi:hypothetical protein
MWRLYQMRLMAQSRSVLSPRGNFPESVITTAFFTATKGIERTKHGISALRKSRTLDFKAFRRLGIPLWDMWRLYQMRLMAQSRSVLSPTAFFTATKGIERTKHGISALRKSRTPTPCRINSFNALRGGEKGRSYHALWKVDFKAFRRLGIPLWDPSTAFLPFANLGLRRHVESTCVF